METEKRISAELVAEALHVRKPESHKGDYGRASLVAGSKGMMGAALLSARACMRSGVGLLTVRVPACGYTILQVGIPEAKCDCDANEEHHTRILIPKDTEVVGIGPGLGQHPETHQAFYEFLHTWNGPLVVDADGLNILSQHPDWLSLLPSGTILSPHPGEMKRLGGDAAALAEKYQLIVILKGHETRIYYPASLQADGQPCVYVNCLHGNAGMAVGGSGDVLTGIILALLAQHYTPQEAAFLGVWLHAFAGDLALADRQSMESLLPSDLIEHLGQAFNFSLIE